MSNEGLQFSPEPFLTYVVGAEHDRRLRRAADERLVRHRFRRRVAR